MCSSDLASLGVPPKEARSLGRLRLKMSKAYGTDHVPLEEAAHHEGEEEHAAVGTGDRKQLH